MKIPKVLSFFSLQSVSDSFFEKGVSEAGKLQIFSPLTVVFSCYGTSCRVRQESFDLPSQNFPHKRVINRTKPRF